MYLYARTITAKRERALDAATFATDIAETVGKVSGLEVRAWSPIYGAPLTELTWTTRVASHAEMGAASEKLLADPGYLEQIGAAADLFESSAEDMIADMVAMAGDGGHTGDYASLVRAQCAGGKVGEAMAWGVDILNHVSGITGRDAIFTRSLYGAWGGVGWITLASSLEEVDAAEAAMGADTSYIGKIDSAGDLFVPGATTSRLVRRIA